MEFDDAGGAALGFRQFISVPFLDGSKRYVSARKSEDENARFVGFIFKQDFYLKYWKLSAAARLSQTAQRCVTTSRITTA